MFHQTRNGMMAVGVWLRGISVSQVLHTISELLAGSAPFLCICIMVPGFPSHPFPRRLPILLQLIHSRAASHADFCYDLWDCGSFWSVMMWPGLSPVPSVLSKVACQPWKDQSWNMSQHSHQALQTPSESEHRSRAQREPAIPSGQKQKLNPATLVL